MRLFAPALALLIATLSFGCAGSSDSTGEASGALGDRDSSQATIRFLPDGRYETSGTIMSGRPLTIAYDEARMPSCRGESHGSKQWTVTGYFRIDGEEAKTFWAAGLAPSGEKNVVQLPPQMKASDLEIWFENTNRWGCHAWDSNFGDNFHFSAQPPPEAPNWMGDVRYGEGNELGDSFEFREGDRAAGTKREITFRVYEPGVTDRENDEAWRALDVKIHSRRFHGGEFEAKPVDIDGHEGNDIRYRIDARSLDPLGVSPSSRSDCAKLGLSFEDDVVHSTVEFTFSVNGVELRPAAGKTFRGQFFAPASRFGVCRAR